MGTLTNILLPERLGPYQIAGRLGAGGMSEVLLGVGRGLRLEVNLDLTGLLSEVVELSAASGGTESSAFAAELSPIALHETLCQRELLEAWKRVRLEMDSYVLSRVGIARDGGSRFVPLRRNAALAAHAAAVALAVQAAWGGAGCGGTVLGRASAGGGVNPSYTPASANTRLRRWRTEMETAFRTSARSQRSGPTPVWRTPIATVYSTAKRIATATGSRTRTRCSRGMTVLSPSRRGSRPRQRLQVASQGVEATVAGRDRVTTYRRPLIPEFAR